jgi:hypothetical protein
MPQTTNQSLERDRLAWEMRQQSTISWAEIANLLNFSQESVARASARRHARRIGLPQIANARRSEAGRLAALQRFNVPTIQNLNNPSSFLPINQRTFGVEIEFKTAPKFVVAQKIADALGIPHIHSFGYHSTICETCNTRIPTHEIYSQWKLERDGSVTENRGRQEYGGEVVSPILSLDADGASQIAKVTKAIKDAGGTINRRCGLHIHIAVGDFNNLERANIVRLWEFQEKVIERFVSKSRINNHYCARVSASRVRQTVNALEQGTSITSFNSKMQSLNVLPYETPKKTFEVRLHQGTLSATKINTWVSLLLAFFHNCAMTAGQATDFSVPDQTVQGFLVKPLLDVLAGKGLIRQRQANYLTDRADALARRN